MPEDIETQYKLMCKDIKHINGSIGKIEKYIEEDRKWKENLFKDLDQRYATNERLDNVRLLLFGVIAVLGTIGLYILNNHL